MALPHLLLIGLTAALPQSDDLQSDDPKLDEVARQFEAEVRPVLAEHCVSCHSGDEPKGGLRLDSIDALRAGVGGEPLFEAGDPDGSLMIEAVRYDDPFLAMPPAGKLPDDAIAALERWIAAGAHLPEAMTFEESDRLRWCFLPPEESELPAESTADPIDLLIDKSLRSAGVKPSPAAARLPWLRRVTFDLTGLPPTPDEVEAFLGDDSEDAKERVVDRLLASPAFGERWARRWLDLMRYAETKAHEFDYPILNAWEYRDYVVRAFDADVPYDRFVTELLAGDLLGDAPRLDPTGRFDESPLGTGAWFLGEEVHSPVSPRGDQTDRVAHQIEVMSKAVIGLGVSCARCHDHKFDPISAEDYHALAGFAISTAPRQLRYESDAINRGIARALRELEGSVRPRAARALAEALRSEAERSSAIVRVHRASAADPVGSPQGSLEELLSRVAAHGIQARIANVVLEDFETGDYETGGLAPWTREGEAFVERPIARDAVDPRQSDMDVRGGFAAGSYSGHEDRSDVSGDAFKGTLTSAPFLARFDHLHFLVNGGPHESTRVELLDAASGEVLAKTSGPRSNRFSARSFDLRAHKGREVRLRLVDDEEGGWGQIGLDNVVGSSEAAADRALAAALRPEQWLQILNADPDGLADGWLAARDSGAPDALVAVLEGRAAPTGQPGEAPKVLVDYADLAGPRWIPNGPAFGPAPRSEGAIALSLEHGRPAIDSITSRPGAVSHGSWRDLEVDGASRTSRGGSLNWVQAGRTLASPTYVVETGRVAHLVRGTGRLITPIASHKMVAGPLHGASIVRVDTGGQWRWIVQNVPSAKGLHVHAEWSATGDAALHVARTVQLAEGEEPPALLGWVGPEPEEPGDESADARLRTLLLEAAELVERGGVQDRVLGDDERAALLVTAEFVARRIPRVRAVIAGALEDQVDALAALDEGRVRRSRLALAALDLDGRDERVLDRGSWTSPLDHAPRAAPRVLLTGLDVQTLEPGAGSGRLELARSLLASESRIVQRVWVNRLWQAMFGTGLVATPDDFGAMGAAPTHPELLDHLALSLERDGWSTKAMLRRIALTETYGRSTAPTASAAELDPKGDLLAHQRVRRLEAEEVRDALLAVSGELDPARFGPPVPIHLTAFMSGRGRPGRSGPLDGDRRRSLYIEVRRNFLHPFLTVFDMPSPSTCHGRRTSANVPAQALAMLNDPFVEERAIALAALAGGAADGLEQQAGVIWRRALGRAPGPDELALVAQLAGDTANGDALIDVAHAVLNTKEFLFLR